EQGEIMKRVDQKRAERVDAVFHAPMQATRRSTEPAHCFQHGPLLVRSATSLVDRRNADGFLERTFTRIFGQGQKSNGSPARSARTQTLHPRAQCFDNASAPRESRSRAPWRM